MKKLLFLLFAGVIACSSADEPVGAAGHDLTLGFDKQVIDPSAAGDVKAAADIDGDGQTDLIVAGLGADTLNWYHYPTWTKTVIAAPVVEFSTDGAAGDVDGDGDQDIVVPDGSGTNNLLWFRNPGGSAAFNAASWSRIVIGTVGGWGKDIELADFNQDGRLDVATRTSSQAMIFFQGASSWSKTALSVANLGNEGLFSGDLDNDSDVDLIVRGAWLRNPGNGNACTPTTWTEHVIGAVDTDFKALAFQADSDPQLEVAFSSSENTADVRVWDAVAAPTGSWTSSLVSPGVQHAHTLQAGDFDQDGDQDLVVGQMHTSSTKLLVIHYRSGSSWVPHTIDSASGLHNGIVLDVGNDGFLDIYGSNWTGNPPLHLWRSHEASVSDTTPPVIANVAAGAVSSSGATITWTTDEPSGGQVEYGLTTAYGSTISAGSSLTQSHSVTLGGLSASTTYHFRVVSQDSSGNASTSANFTFATSAVAPPPSDLLARWACDEGSGSTVGDSSGAGRHGSFNGTWAGGQLGSACVFNGSTQYVGVPTFNVAGSALTIAGWAQVSAFNSNVDQRFVSKASGVQANDHDWMVSETNSGGRRLRFRLKTGTTTTTLIASSGELLPGTWFHFAATYNGSQMCLYLDAAQVGCTAKSGTLAQSTKAINLGRNADGSNYLNGKLDDVRVYGRALTAGEIANVRAGM